MFSTQGLEFGSNLKEQRHRSREKGGGRLEEEIGQHRANT